MMIYSGSWQTFFVRTREPIFAALRALHYVSVTTSPVDWNGAKAGTDSRQTKECGYVPIKFYFQKLKFELRPFSPITRYKCFSQPF